MISRPRPPAAAARAAEALLARYRGTGADLPFGNPGRDHGAGMEGYFWRFTLPEAGRVVVALCGVSRAPDGRWGALALAGHPGGFLRSRLAPEATAAPASLGVRAGPFFAGDADGLSVDLGPDARLEARLVAPFRWPRVRPFGGLGPAQSVPGLSQYWHPHVLGGRVSGRAVLGGEEVSLDGATVYAEKNWGGAFPGRWWWGQAQGFDHPELCVAFAGGLASLGPVPMTATALVVRLGDELLRFGLPASPVVAKVDGTRWHIRALGLRHRVDIEAVASPDGPHRLPVPVPAERRMTTTAAQHLAGFLAIQVRRRGRTLFSGESALAGLELGTAEAAAPAPAKAWIGRARPALRPAPAAPPR